MKIYRGSHLKNFSEVSHPFVARIQPKELETAVQSKTKIRFNITKDATERGADGFAEFEEADIIPMARGLLARLTLKHKCLGNIEKIMADMSTDNQEKITAIQDALKQSSRIRKPKTNVAS